MNRILGHLGEKFAVEVEKRRLRSFGRDDLAARVEWVAVTCGDGVGFDVLSFDEIDDSERFIEVKTTGLGKHFPFYVTANEVRCSEDCPDRFRLYRVFDFARRPRIYVVAGAMSGTAAGAGRLSRLVLGPRLIAMDRDDVLRRFDALGVWTQGDQRAPTSPSWSSTPWAAGSEDYLRSPSPRPSRHRPPCSPEQPFSRLQRDGVWVVKAPDHLPRKAGDTIPRVAALHRFRPGCQLRPTPQAVQQAGVHGPRRGDPRLGLGPRQGQLS